MAVSLKIPPVVVDDADLVRVSRENPGYQIEREEDGTFTVAPNFTDRGARSGEAFYRLKRFAATVGAELSIPVRDSGLVGAERSSLPMRLG